MQEPPLEPWLFSRIALSKPWAGNALPRVFPDCAADFPPGTGESIEVADLPEIRTPVRAGEARGHTLSQLIARHGRELSGREGEFPLAVKFLDTAQPLSIQCHPGDDGGTSSKSEAWLVLEAAPDAVIWQGLKPGLNRTDFERALAAGIPEETLNARSLKAGDFLFNPARMIHAVGPGLALLELQQSCDVTLRFFDWPQTGRKPRELQVAEAFKAADFTLPPPEIVNTFNHEGLLELHRGPPFSVQSLNLSGPRRFVKEWPGFTLMTCLEGDCELIIHGRGEIHTEHLRSADTLLVPAVFGEFEFFPRVRSRLVLTYSL